MAVARVGSITAEPRLTLPRLSLEMAGLMALLLGAWTAFVSFVGPAFNWSADGSAAWHWNSAHVFLFLIPGAAAFLAGLFAMVATLGAERAMVGLCGVLAMLAGAWLIIGPVTWPVLSGTGFFRTNVSPASLLVYWIGYSLGPGGLLLGLGAFIVGSDRFRAVPGSIAPAVEAPGARSVVTQPPEAL